MGGNELTVVATSLKLKNLWKLRRFFRLNGGIKRQLKDVHGLEDYWVSADFLRLRFYTLSVWESEQAVSDFVKSSAHREAMAAFDEISVRQESGFIRWKTSNPALTTWKEATERLLALGQQ